MNNTKLIGIDLGTANTVIYSVGKGIVLREPSVVAYEKGSSRLLSTGRAAKEMLGRTSKEVSALYPLRDGVIAHYEFCTEMLSDYLKRSLGTFPGLRPKAIVCIPHGVTEVERNAVIDSVIEAGAGGVILVEETLCAAIGACLPVLQPRGSLIVDIGGGTTEIAVISKGGIATWGSSKIAGSRFNREIIAYIKREFNVLIGEATAEEMKIKIGSAHKSFDKSALDVKGRNMRDGKAAEFTVYSSEVREALRESLTLLFEDIRSVLDGTAPELCSDIYDSGITLCGGGASLAGLPELLAELSSLPVTLAVSPSDCVINGIARLCEDEKLRESVRGLVLHR